MNLSIFEDNKFMFKEEYCFNSKYHSYVFIYNDYCIIVDDCFDRETNAKLCFDYSKYCEMQNSYSHQYKFILRYNYEDNEEEIINAIHRDIEFEKDNDYLDDGGIFSESHIDNTPLEEIFENVFIEAYGYEALECLHKEYSISAGGKRNYFIDYALETSIGNYAFEENGVHYHHPCEIGKDNYNALLKKQNLISLLGYKVFRFSTDNLYFKDKIVQELKNFLPDKTQFFPKPILKNNRGLTLYSHQSDILSQLDKDRLNDKNTALVVIPTAAGKSEICITDLSKEYVRKNVKKVLIMVPSLRIKDDWLNRIEAIKEYYPVIDVCFYNTVFIRKAQLPEDYYDYIIFDEAHHAQASNCKASIQYFKPKYLVGLTATDERLDHKKLEEIFGVYNVKLTLLEAIEKGIISNIRAYRLESNIDLSEIRFNGKEYDSSDLERTIFVESRNELIVDLLLKYFSPRKGFYKQGIIFCVSVAHAKKLASLLKNKGLTAEAVYGGNNKTNYYQQYSDKQIQFLCSCNVITEGWDSPQTEIVVMARPTLSKVLYTQQIGRGLRRYPGKECLYLIDVVDEYSANLRPWSFNSLFHLSTYSHFMGVVNNQGDYLSILGLSEREIAMKEIDIFTFEEKYKDFLSLEQAARELYIGTQTLRSWNDKKKYASLYLPIGSRVMPYFSPNDILKIRTDKKLEIHTDDTILKDFKDFIIENKLAYSFKLIFILASFKVADQEGNIRLDLLVDEYRRFYLNRINKGLPVDRANCVYSIDNLKNDSFVKRSILDNPFEKFERKRFFYHSKDLNIISFNNTLWTRMTKEFIDDIIAKEKEFLRDYYENYGGLDNEYKF